jgi:argonaute-like protein implicated in RNA metabolism and viral defense
MKYHTIINYQFNSFLHHIKNNCIEEAEHNTGGYVMHEIYLMKQDIFVHVPDLQTIYRMKRAISNLSPKTIPLISDAVGEQIDAVATVARKNIDNYDNKYKPY